MIAPSAPDRDAWASNMVALYAAMIEDGLSFSQAVYGDGEWLSILGTGRGKNDQGETFDPALGAMLRETLLKPRGQWCVMWPGRAGSETHQQARAWIAEHQPAVHWLPFRPLSWAAVLGLAAPFFRACRQRRVVLVGPEHLKGVSRRVLAPARHVLVPLPDAWREVDALEERIRLAADREDDLVLFCAGQAATVLIHRLSDIRYPTLLDIGSMLDPYAGVYSRRVWRDPDWQRDVMPRNVP